MKITNHTSQISSTKQNTSFGMNFSQANLELFNSAKINKPLTPWKNDIFKKLAEDVSTGDLHVHIENLDSSGLFRKPPTIEVASSTKPGLWHKFLTLIPKGNTLEERTEQVLNFLDSSDFVQNARKALDSL